VSFVPGLAVLSSYQTRWLRSDVVAGLVLTALLVPQGMAYAELAGLTMSAHRTASVDAAVDDG
jgi:MFS superfamily sulfate permease-like transporter